MRRLACAAPLFHSLPWRSLSSRCFYALLCPRVTRRPFSFSIWLSFIVSFHWLSDVAPCRNEADADEDSGHLHHGNLPLRQVAGLSDLIAHALPIFPVRPGLVKRKIPQCAAAAAESSTAYLVRLIA